MDNGFSNSKMKIFRLELPELIKIGEITYHRVPLPKYATEGSAAFDLYSANTREYELKPHMTIVIPLGIKVAVDKGYKLSLKCRSGLSVNGITVENSPGIIDNDFRGEVKAVIANHSNEPFLIPPLSRICQGEIEIAPQYGFTEVKDESELGDTKRGGGGLGSTGL